MNGQNLKEIIKHFRWEILAKFYGSAHSSFIGFLSTEWITLDCENSIIDGAPSPIIGTERKGQKNADVLLCKGNIPYIIVEVETNVNKYEDKIDVLIAYLNNTNEYPGLEIGILLMSNLCTGEKKYKHNWEPVKKILSKVEPTIGLISIEKSSAVINNTPLGKIRKRNDYYPWDINKIDFWIHSGKNNILNGNLWSKFRK